MDYEEAANKLIVYSKALAKGFLGTAAGLSVGEEPVLEQLAKEKGGVHPSELADKLGYTRSRMTRILDALEAKGYVERTPDEVDRRRVVARATKKGREHARATKADGVGNLAGSLAAMGEQETHELLRGLEQAYRITYDRPDIPAKREEL